MSQFERPAEISVDLDQDLTERIRNHYIREGQLYGSLEQKDLTLDERKSLAQAGWVQHNYVDHPVMEPPQTLVDWTRLQAEHRDRTLHAISHRLPSGTPWAETRQAILEEMLGSLWDQQVDRVRILLHSWAYASVWSLPDDSGQPTKPESAEMFFFYTARMQNAAEAALQEITRFPDLDDEFWQMVDALSQHADNL